MGTCESGLSQLTIESTNNDRRIRSRRSLLRVRVCGAGYEEGEAIGVAMPPPVDMTSIVR